MRKRVSQKLEPLDGRRSGFRRKGPRAGSDSAGFKSTAGQAGRAFPRAPALKAVLRIQGLGEGESEVSTFELAQGGSKDLGIDTRAISAEHDTLAKGNADRHGLGSGWEGAAREEPVRVFLCSLLILSLSVIGAVLPDG